MYAVRAEGKGVIARIRDFLNDNGVAHSYKARVFRFASTEAILDAVLAIGKENPDWNVHEELVLGGEGSEIVSDGIPVVETATPVVRMTIAEHAAEQIVIPELTPDEEQARQLAEMAAASSPLPPLTPTPTPIVLPEPPSDADAALEQARQLAEMAAASAPTSANQPAATPSPSSPLAAAAPEVGAADAAVEQARQLAEMSKSTGALPSAAPRKAARTAKVFVLAVGYQVPSLDAEVQVAPLDTAQALYLRLNRQARLRDRVHHVELFENGLLVDRFPHD